MITAVDLFCGAGGATTGMRQAGVEVLIAVNHDQEAIKAHEANHPETRHFIEDIRDFDTKQLPKEIDILWVSAECTNYSGAKGGLPRDADSRTLPCEIVRYATACKPRFIIVENVKEFMSWGPLDKKGRPVSRDRGEDYLRWVRSIENLGYHYDWRLLDSANFGAYTSRLRYFGIFARAGESIRWPRPTHAKRTSSKGTIFDAHLKPWKPAREILDLDDKGPSIIYEPEMIKRGKPLSESTCKRIEYGMNRYKDEGEEVAMIDRQTFQATPAGIDEPYPTIMANRDHYLAQFTCTPYTRKIPTVRSTNDPLRTITTFGNISLASVDFLDKTSYSAPGSSVNSPIPTILATRRHHYLASTFLMKYYSSNGNANNCNSLNIPLATIPTRDTFSLLRFDFLKADYNSKLNVRSVKSPVGAITVNPKFSLMTVDFLNADYSGAENVRSVESPLGTVTTKPKFSLLTVDYIVKQWSGDQNSQSIQDPLHTITTVPRPSKVQVLMAAPSDDIPLIFERSDTSRNTNCPWCRQVGDYIVDNRILDVRYRMLKVKELMLAQGFPMDYQFFCGKTLQKKFIGNSVVPLMAKKLVQAIFPDSALQQTA